MSETTITADEKQLVAVIDIGSGGIRMVLAEVGGDLSIRYLENLQKHVPLGKDVFSKGRISPGTMRQAIRVLKDFTNVMEEYGVTSSHAIATAAVRDASNRDNFVDQVFVRTGIDIEVIEGAEENRLGMIAVERGLEGIVDFSSGSFLIVEVGAGSTVLISLEKGEVKATRTLSVGSVRLPSDEVVGQTEPAMMKRLVERNAHASSEWVGLDDSVTEIDSFIALGSEMRFVARILSSGETGKSTVLSADEFLKFVDSLGKLSVEEVSSRYGLDFADAETLYPALLYYKVYLQDAGTPKLIVPMTSIRDGLVLEQAQILAGRSTSDVSRLVISSAKRLGTKYDYDERHCLWVAHLAVTLFDEFARDHGLGSRERLLLEVAAILHEIGMYISPSGRHKHSAYLIDASDIFGLRARDKEIVSNVARYHRGALPRATHTSYWSLRKQDRARVAKLAAILRLAIALDTSRSQRIRDITVVRDRLPYEIWVAEEAGDTSLERDTLRRKSRMFAEFFGADIQLKQGRPPKAR